MPLVTVEDAIDDLPSIVAGENENPRSYGEDGSKLTPYQRMMRKKSDVLHNHLGWKHTEKLLNRLKDIKPGKNLFDGRPKRYFSQAYGRLHPRGLARTITANFHNPGGGRFLHYRDLRAISVREAARLQGFDDEFLFIKSPKIQERCLKRGRRCTRRELS
ncbi:MAG TPA: DNA cytosine methyltransferase [Desulfobacterales bacterium]|nr:DNA cytosine methyltransferase [Desulfobacterales bacterium]